MNKRLLSLLTLAAFAATGAACNGDARDGDVVEQDTALSTVTGIDTAQVPVEVQTEDTVVRTTTVTEDTIEGGVTDTAAATTRP